MALSGQTNGLKVCYEREVDIVFMNDFYIAK